MLKQLLNGNWQFRQAGTDTWLAATVPGGVHTDLLALGKIPDPFVADNELRVMWVAETDWEYKRTFNVDSTLLAQENIILACDGLDTIADVYVNEIWLGHAENMFRSWKWDVKDLLVEGENELHIFFGSPVRFITSKQSQLALQGGGDIPGGPHLRKAPCHWGWDWGPKLPPIGIWKDIRLEGYSARLENITLQQSIDEDIATISAEITTGIKPGKELTTSLKVAAPDGQEWFAQDTLFSVYADDDQQICTLQVEIKNPQLWWPSGYGSQPLYALEITLQDGKNILDQRSYRIGLRTIELSQEPDQWGKEFTFYINGVRLFAKGADWIPADSLPTRITKEYLEMLIKSAADANMNMLRVWGGGYYPEEMFFDLCDQYGILVWQDFMFACGIYPADADFFENVQIEAIEQIRRLRHRASLALWCGNNEMEQGWCDWGWNKPEDPINQRLKDGYDRMFHHMLPELLEFEDPDHPYWPSSASANMPFEGANNQVQGDCHYWDVWHGRKPFTAYRTQFPRFMSEFGFQALPPLKTIATYADPADWNMTSYIMEHHQRSGSGNGAMVAQMTDTFRMPKDFPAMVYLSLVLQAEGIRYGVEHWRRNRDRVSGTLIWQLNDCWPVASWASLDYFGRWKALHYAARRFYTPLLLSVADDGKIMKVHLTSDLVEPVGVLVRWRLETLDGQVIQKGEQPIHAQALADTLVGSYNFSTLVTAENQRQVVFVTELWRGAELVTHSVTPFVANKHLELRNPELSIKTHVEGQTLLVDVSAQTLARFVALSVDEADPVFSDNYFDIPAGATVNITCPLPKNWTPTSKVSATSLYDSFA